MREKQLIRSLAILLSSIAVSLGALLLILAMVTQTAFFRSWLRTTLIQETQKRFGLALSVDRIGGNLVTGLTLEKGELQGSTGERLSLDRLKVRFSPISLLFGRVTFPLVSVSGLHLTVIRTAEGYYRVLPFSMPPSSAKQLDSSSLPLLDFRSLLIQDGSLTFRDYFRMSAMTEHRQGLPAPQEPTEIVAQGIQADLSLGLYFRQGARDWETHIRSLSLSSLSPYQVTIQKIQGGIGYHQGSLEINGLEALTSQSQIWMQGKVTLGKEPFFDVRARFPKISLSELQSISDKARQALPATILRLSKLEGEASVRGTLKDLACTSLLFFNAGKQKVQWQTTGTLDFSDPGLPLYHLRTKFKQFPVSWWLPPKKGAGLSLPQGLPESVDLSARIKGEGIRPGEISVEFDADISPFILFGRPVTAVDLSGQLDTYHLQLTKLEVYSPVGRARLQGQIDLRSPFFYQLTLSFQQLDLEGIKGFPSTRLAGEAQLQGNWEFSGISGHPGVSGLSWYKRGNQRSGFQASGSIRLFPSRVGERFLDSLLLEGDFEDGLVHLSQGNISMDGLNLSLFGMASSQRLHLTWNLRELDLSQLKEGMGSTLASLPEGIISGRGKVTGNPKSPRVEGELAGRDISFRDYRVSNVVVKGIAEGSSFETLDFDAEVQVSSFWRSQQKLQESLKVKANKKGPRITWQMQGVQEGNRSSQARGSMEIPQARQVSARIDEVSFPLGEVTWRSIGPIQVEWDSGVLKIISLRVGAGQGQGYLSVQGEIKRTGQQTMQIQMSGFPLQAIAKWTGQKISLSGTLDGEVSIAGTRSLPEISGNLEAVKGKWSPIATGAPCSFDRLAQEFAYSQKNLTFTASLTQAGKETLHLSGNLPVDLSFSPVQDRLSGKGVQVKADIQEMDLSFLPSILPQMAEVKGAISGTGEMTGSLKDPQFGLSVGFINTSFRIKPLLQVFKVRKALIKGNSRRIVFEEVELAGKSGMGKFSGVAELSGFSVKSLDARLKMDKWKIVYSRDTYFVFDGDLSAQGLLSRISLSGSVQVPEGKVKLKDLAFSRQSNQEIQVVEERGDEMRLAEKKAAFFKPNVSMNVDVIIPRNLWVNGDQTDLELKGELGIRKAYAQNPVVTGSIESIRGTYTFYSKEFTIQKAIVQFQGTPEINPLLDMITVYKVGETNINILITGTRKSPIVRLQSDDKTLSQDQIISLLVFGHPLENLNQREAASLQGEAFALLGRMVAMQVLGIFGEKLPLDTVQIRASKEGTSTLEVGKYLTRNIFVSFGKEFGQEKGSEQIVVEYYLYSNLTLNAEIRNDQRSGVDLIWKKDF